MRIRALKLLMLIAGASWAGYAQATPECGRTPLPKVVSNAVNIGIEVRGDILKLELDDPNPINMLNGGATLAPIGATDQSGNFLCTDADGNSVGGYTGWHAHSGPGFVIVREGMLTIENTQGCYCDYPQGSVIYDGPAIIHNALNRTYSPVTWVTWFFLPAATPPGSNNRIDEPVQTGPCEPCGPFG